MVSINTLFATKMLKKFPKMLQKMRKYQKGFDESKHMSFLIKDNELLKT